MKREAGMGRPDLVCAQVGSCKFRGNSRGIWRVDPNPTPRSLGQMGQLPLLLSELTRAAFFDRGFVFQGLEVNRVWTG